MMSRHPYTNYSKSILLYALIFFIGCNEKNQSEIGGEKSKQSTTYFKGKDNIISNKEISEHKETLSNKNISIGCTSEIINNNFSNNVIDVIGISKVGMLALCKKSFTIKRVVTESEVDSGEKDTTYLVTSGKSRIILYNLDKNITGRIPSWRFAEINDNSFIIKYNIAVGMTKNNFLSKFRSKSIDCDTIKITDDERMSLHTFLFKNNRLWQIKLISGDE